MKCDNYTDTSSNLVDFALNSYPSNNDLIREKKISILLTTDLLRVSTYICYLSRIIYDIRHNCTSLTGRHIHSVAVNGSAICLQQRWSRFQNGIAHRRHGPARTPHAVGRDNNSPEGYSQRGLPFGTSFDYSLTRQDDNYYEGIY